MSYVSLTEADIPVGDGHIQMISPHLFFQIYLFFFEPDDCIPRNVANCHRKACGAPSCLDHGDIQVIAPYQ